MEFNFFTEPVTFCIVNNYYTEDEIDAIHRELNSIKPNLKPPENTGTARTVDGIVSKQNKGMFLNEPRGPIFELSRKLFREVAWETQKNNWMYRWLSGMDDKILVSYYESGDHYKSHTDHAVLTAIYYTWKEPRQFSGGDLYFGKYKVPIENNSLVIFPSSTQHSVTPVIGEGRWAISQFISHTPPKENRGMFYYHNFLDVTRFATAQDLTFRSSSWAFRGSSNGGPPKFWMLELSNNQFFIDMVQPLLREKGLKIIRIYANGQSFGQDGEFHQDDSTPDSWTLLLYLNDIKEEEIDNWGGGTQFKMENAIENQYPIPNMAILFRSDIWHRGLAPSRTVGDIRVTVTWKLQKA